MQRDAESVLDILLAAELIEQFVRGVEYEQFEANHEKQSAVLHQLMVVGEAAKRLSVEFRDSHPDVPWTRMAGMRDRLIHAYDDVDLKLVWEAVNDVLPPIVQYLRNTQERSKDA
jgi:uncharacterized protein with HEPN domain